jgi:hypothetical protein
MATVVPGERVGQVNIGARRQSVISALGRPQRSRTSSVTGLRVDTYLGSQPPNELRRLLRVIFSADEEVIQIEFNSPNFVTADGLSTNSSVNEFRARHPNAASSSFEFPNDETGIGETREFFDDTPAGIAYMLSISGEPDADAVFIIVHLRNRAVLPNPDEEAGVPSEPFPFASAT